MTRIGRILTDKIISIRFIRVIHKPVLHSLSVLIFLKQRIGSRNQVSHRPNGTDSQVTVQDDDVGIFSALQRTRTVGYPHQACRSFGSHANGIGQRDIGFLNHRTDQHIVAILPASEEWSANLQTPSSMIIREPSSGFTSLAA